MKRLRPAYPSEEKHGNEVGKNLPDKADTKPQKLVNEKGCGIDFLAKHLSKRIVTQLSKIVKLLLRSSGSEELTHTSLNEKKKKNVHLIS